MLPQHLPRYQCNITLPGKFRDSSSSGEIFVRIQLLGTDWTIACASELTANQLAAVHVIQKTLEQLSYGSPIDRYFNPTLHVDANKRLVKCKWRRSGKLVLLENESTPGSLKRYQHAETPDEAITRRGVFTCTQLTYSLLPKQRVKL